MEQDRIAFAVGNEGGDHFKVTLREREFSESSDDRDANWIVCRIDVMAGGFRGNVDNAFITAGELQNLRDEFTRFNQTLKGTVDHDPVEPFLIFSATMSSLGSIQVRGEVWETPKVGNHLAFEFTIDQTFLPGVVGQLERACVAYPVRS